MLYSDDNGNDNVGKLGRKHIIQDSLILRNPSSAVSQTEMNQTWKNGLGFIFGCLTTTCSFSFWDLHFSNELSSSMIMGGGLGPSARVWRVTRAILVLASPSYIARSVPHLNRKHYISCQPPSHWEILSHFFGSIIGQGGGVTTHPSNVCWSAPVLFGGSPSLDLARQLKFEEENIWGGANKNGSFARLRGRSKVSLC